LLSGAGPVSWIVWHEGLGLTQSGGAKQ
jgi:hypothetical protein